jgi:hypothetical protein
MDELRSFVNAHTLRIPTTQECTEPNLDIAFFKVSTVNNPSPDELKRLVEANKEGVHCDVDLFDGKEHSYLEVGGWIGDQGYALTLMALGHLLGLWKCLTPKIMMPFLDDETVMQMAGAGYISVLK